MTENLFERIPEKMPEELSSLLVDHPAVKIERIVSAGQVSPPGFWYDQDRDEWVLLVAGSAVLSIETDAGVARMELGPGDHLLLPAHQRHRIEATSATEKTIWLAVYY